MDLQSRKLAFIQEFLRIQSEDIVFQLEKLMRKQRSTLFEQNMNPMSLEKFNEEIDKALDDSKNNRLTESSDLKEKIKKWD